MALKAESVRSFATAIFVALLLCGVVQAQDEVGPFEQHEVDPLLLHLAEDSA